MKDFFKRAWYLLVITNWWAVGSIILVAHMAFISFLPAIQIDIEGSIAQATAAIVFAIFGVSERRPPSTGAVEANPLGEPRRRK